MLSLSAIFSERGQRNWIIKKANGNKLAVYYNGDLVGYFNKQYLQISWRKAFGYTLPESVILAAAYVKLNE